MSSGSCHCGSTHAEAAHRRAAGVLVLDGPDDARLAPVHSVGQRSVMAVPVPLDVLLLALPAEIPDIQVILAKVVSNIVRAATSWVPEKTRGCVGVFCST